jgi:hypothetical protein
MMFEVPCDQLEFFIEAFTRANREGLGVEFFSKFIDRVRAGDTVSEAIRVALYEWDL